MARYGVRVSHYLIGVFKMNMSNKREKADTLNERVEKLNKLLRKHRQCVFGVTGDLHHRAMLRLKRTATFKAMCRNNEYAAQVRAGERLTGMGY
jgi:hypothetical protein